MVVIVMNSFVIGFETVEEWKVPHKNVFKALDELFLAIYTMEFLMKLYAEPRGYWKSSYNRFDFSILALSYVQVIMDELNVGDKILTPLRLLRGLWESPWQLDWREGKSTHKSDLHNCVSLSKREQSFLDQVFNLVQSSWVSRQLGNHFSTDFSFRSLVTQINMWPLPIISIYYP